MTKQEMLQALFYDLLRDASPAGDIEHAIREFETLCCKCPPPDRIEYSNKHLAKYAEELAQRLLKMLDRESEP